MFQRIFLLLLYTGITTFVICESKCEEYILIMEQDTCHGNTLAPTKLKDIRLDRFDDCTDPTNELTYKDLIANKSCVIELNYSDFEQNCTSIANSDVNLIYVNGNNTISDLKVINNSSEQVFNVMQCIYTDNICIYYNGTATDLNTIKNGSEANTILALIGTKKSTKHIDKIVDYTENVTDFNCTRNINATEIINHDQFITLTFDIIRKYSCQNKSPSDLINNTNILHTRTVNVYFETDFIYKNNSSIDYIFCANNFKPVNSETQSIRCDVIENETISTTLDTEATTIDQTTEMSKTTDDVPYSTDGTSVTEETATFTGKSDTTVFLNTDTSIIPTPSLTATTVTLDSTESESVTEPEGNITTPTHSRSFFRNHLMNETIVTRTELKVTKEIEKYSTPTIDMTNTIETEVFTTTASDIMLLGTGLSGSRSSDMKQLENTTIEDELTPSTTEENIQTKSEDKSTPSPTEIETEHTAIKSEKVTENPGNVTTNLPNVTLTTDSTYSKEYRNKDPIDIYTLGPWAILTLVFSIIGTVTVVTLYAGYIFRPRKRRYQPAPTRDWANMEDTAF